MKTRAITCAALAALTAIFTPCAADARMRHNRPALLLDTDALPGCHTRDGVRVRYIAVPGTDMDSPAMAYRIRKNSDPRTVRAYRTQGLPSKPGAYVVYDPDIVSGMPLATQADIMAHECGHHHLGHTDNEDPNTPARVIRRQERDADCEGVRIMRETYRLPKTEIVKGLKFFNSPIMNESDAEHDSGRARYKHSLRCIPKSPYLP